MSVPGGRITAAATTGPASGPLPASSTPAIALYPALRNSASTMYILCLRSCSFVDTHAPLCLCIFASCRRDS